MTVIILLLLVLAFSFSDAEDNELFSVISTPPEKGQSVLPDPGQNQSTRLGAKDPSLTINEPLEKSSKAGDPKYALHPLPSGVWPKHSDPRPGPHNKSKKGPKNDRLIEHNSEKNRGEASLALPKTPLTAATNRTQKVNVDPYRDPHTYFNNPPQIDPDSHPNSRPRGHPHIHPATSPRRDPPTRKLDPEENRPGGKSSLYQSGGANRNNSRSSVLLNRRSSSLLYHFDILKRESDFTHEAVCMSECRKEKEERDHYCYSEFAVNGIVHDIDMVRKGIRLITLMVSSDGFYKMSRLYVTPDSFFLKVRLLVLDTYKCSKPCPDIKLGSRYIVMGQIYHRRRHLPNDLLALLGGKLKPGDGLLRSNNYVKRFNKRRHQKALEATRSKCR
ncbi:UPF0450 protein C17orf58-like [Oncorhynchus nerka]|uniref:UPF0450 protein C17orf58-like n=1 Tax=Oncorhynchus nerka TaxID=8023 RepID=UPI0011314F28|nr:uncharacterized protein LOC115103839 [Oncorhynchus nerka]XP_035634899.1 UPF0450 protein C17orf58-like [Oncorhynchus keta]